MKPLPNSCLICKSVLFEINCAAEIRVDAWCEEQPVSFRGGRKEKEKKSNTRWLLQCWSWEILCHAWANTIATYSQFFLSLSLSGTAYQSTRSESFHIFRKYRSYILWFFKIFLRYETQEEFCNRKDSETVLSFELIMFWRRRICAAERWTKLSSNLCQ